VLRLGFEQRRGVLVLLVLDELADKLQTGVRLLFHGLVAPRQEHLALDLHEGGGHDQKLARVLHIDPLEHAQVFQELLRHLGDRNVTDIDLVPLDQVEQ
jgi:hypothetical protein